jgi:hypothetical protein
MKTSKHQFEKQIATQDNVAEKLKYIDEKVSTALGEVSVVSAAIARSQELESDLDKKYVIGNQSRDFIEIRDFLDRYEGDPAIQVSIFLSSVTGFTFCFRISKQCLAITLSQD